TGGGFGGRPAAQPLLLDGALGGQFLSGHPAVLFGRFHSRVSPGAGAPWADRRGNRRRDSGGQSWGRYSLAFIAPDEPRPPPRAMARPSGSVSSGYLGRLRFQVGPQVPRAGG